MGLNFPDSPTDGTTFAPVGAPEYIYANGAWLQVAGPVGPITGATFFDSMAQAHASMVPGDATSITLKGYLAPGDGGGAQYVKVLSEPSHPGKFQSGDGAWWELKAPGEVTLEMFGGRGDGVAHLGSSSVQPGTDNWQAFQDALSYGRMLAGTVVQASASIRLLRGVYAVSQTIEIDWDVRISGDGGTAQTNAHPTSIMVFPLNVIMFKYWSNSTPDPAPGSPIHGMNAQGALMENIRLVGAGGTLVGQSPTGYVPDITKHGIVMHTNVFLKHIAIQNCAGDGLHVTAGTSAEGAGSANEMDFYGVRVIGAGRHGIFIDGGDTNAGCGIRMDVSNCGGYGIFDSSLLGNTWVGCHSSANGIKARVWWANKRWQCLNEHISEADEEPGSPGAEMLWEFFENADESGAYPVWAVGVQYVPGGAYSTTTADTRVVQGVSVGTVFIGCYAEGGQGASRLSPLTMFIGGTHANKFLGGQVLGPTGAYKRFIFNTELHANAAKPGASVSLAHNDFDPITVFANGDVTSGLKFPQWDTDTNCFNIWHGGTKSTGQSVLFPTSITKIAASGGRSSALSSGEVIFPNGIFSGDGLANARWLGNATASPTTGVESAQGDIVFNRAPTSGEPVGWICVQGGIPATTALWLDNHDYALGARVKTAAGNFYRNKFEPGSNKSLIEPTHMPSPVLSDGYGWVYIDDRAIVAPAWTSKKYLIDDFVTAGGRVYKVMALPAIVPVPVSTIAPSHSTGLADPGDGYQWRVLHTWASGTDYAVDDLVRISGFNFVYRCVTDGGGTSTVSPVKVDTSVYADVYQWRCIGDPTAIPQWVSGTEYPTGALVIGRFDRVFRCIISSGPSTGEPFHLMVHGDYTPYSDGYQWDHVMTISELLPWQYGYAYLLGVAGPNDNSVYIRAGNGKVYVPSVVGSGIKLSKVEPTHTNVYAAPDGYTWTFVDNGGSTDDLWVSGTNYALNAVVTAPDTFSMYKCTVDPGGAILSTFPPTVTNRTHNATDGYSWLPMHEGGTTETLWVSGTNYALDAVVRNGTNSVFRCVKDPGAAITSTVEPSLDEIDWHLWKYLGNTSPIWKSWGLVDA